MTPGRWHRDEEGFSLIPFPGVRITVRLPDFWPPHVQTLRQIHSALVVDADHPPVSPDPPEGDGWLTQHGRPVGIKTADCYPVVLLSPAHPTAAVVLHAGWRGVHQGIVEEGVRRFRAVAGVPERWIAVLGPGIDPRVYEVDEEFQHFAAPYLSRSNGSWFLDLPGWIRAKLLRLGIRHVIGPPAYTGSDPTLPSYRRTGTRNRLMLTWVEPET